MESSNCILPSGNNCGSNSDSTSREPNCAGIDKGPVIKKTYRDRSVSERVAKILYEMQKSKELFDILIELKTENGDSFKVDKLVLSTVSPFFAKLLDKDMEFIEKNADTFLVRQISASNLQKIIQFMYTGEIEISTDIAKEIVETALFLNLFTLVQYGCEILIEIVNKENCLEWLKYSETCLHYGEELTKKCLELMCEEFNNFVNLPDFLELSSDTIKLLIEQELKTFTEENLFLAIKKWIIYDLEGRKQFIKILFDPIQFKNFGSKFAKQHIFDDNPLLKVEDFKDKLISLFHNNWIKTEMNFINDVKLFGLFNNFVFKYDFWEECFSEYITKIDDCYQSFGITTFDKKKILKCGGKSSNSLVSTCTYFSIEDSKWYDLPSMTQSFCPKLISLNNEVYAFDKNGYSFEVFDTNRLLWCRSDSRLDFFFIQNFSLCHSNNSIYCVISDGRIQRFDSRQFKRDILYSGTLVIAQTISSSETNGNFIYGFTGSYFMTFDIRNKKWLEPIKLNEEINGGVSVTCSFDNKIYIFPYNICKDNKFLIYNLSDLTFYDRKNWTSKVDRRLDAIFTL